MEQVTQLKVSTNSNPSSVGGAITAIIKDTKKAEIQVVGAGALNQAIKGIIVARGFLTPVRN